MATITLEELESSYRTVMNSNGFIGETIVQTFAGRLPNESISYMYNPTTRTKNLMYRTIVPRQVEKK